MKNICRFLLKLLGWKGYVTVELPSKCVICVAPHTSNWDFLIGRLFYSAFEGKPYFLMKKDWFFFPLGPILKALGGIPVDRRKKTSLTDEMIQEFNRRDHFQLAIAPEGTRKKNARWKSGFYYIAKSAGVPISLAHMDYRLKEIGISKVFIPTGDEKKDIEEIKQHYKDCQGKYPDQFAI